MQELYKSLSTTTSYLNNADQERLEEAFWFAQNAHKGQFRRTGEDYITHPVSVAKSLAELHIDRDSLICALLHDVVEDTPYTLEDIKEKFGEQVAAIVSGLSRLESYDFSSANKQQAENFSKMLIATAKDMRVLLIKLADRMDNMKTIGIFHHQKQRRISHETLEIYAPLAAKIGLNTWGGILEDLSFKTLYPHRYNILDKAIKHIKGDRQALVDESLKAIENELKQFEIPVFDISGREKQPYSVFKKMKRKGIRFEQMQDLFAFRVVVKDVDSCYRALGVLHRLFRPVPGRFKDYIALPKPNGYQSLHTVLINAQGVQAEVQIRSQEMHYNAEHGVAANWIYKRERIIRDDTPISHDWLNNLLNLYGEDPSNMDLWEYAQSDLAPKEVFVFTPQGKLITLPGGATALDFAYAVHSKIGNHAVACEINLQRHPLNARLSHGEVIKIITNQNSHPLPSWLDFVKTTKARQNIRVQLRQRKDEDLIVLGRQMLEGALTENHWSIEEIPEQVLNAFFKECKIENLSELFLNLGRGMSLPMVVVGQIMDIMSADEKKPEKLKKTQLIDTNPVNGLIVDDVKNLGIQFGRCCCPIHGDYIVGHLSLERGLVIHRRLCPNVKNLYKEPENSVVVKWNPQKKILLNTRLRIEMERGVGILAELSSLIAQQDVDIIDINVSREIHVVVVNVEISVYSRYNLAELIRELRSKGNIKRVQRVRLKS